MDKAKGKNETAPSKESLAAKIAALQLEMVEATAEADAATIKLVTRIEKTAWITDAAKVLGGFAVNEDGTVNVKSGASGTKTSTLLFGIRNLEMGGKSLDHRSISKAMAAVRDIDPSGSLKSLYGKNSPVRVAGMSFYRDLFDTHKVTAACDDGTTRPLNEVIPAVKGTPPDIRA